MPPATGQGETEVFDFLETSLFYGLISKNSEELNDVKKLVLMI